MRFRTKMTSVLAAMALAAGTLFVATPAQAVHLWMTNSKNHTVCVRATEAKAAHLKSQGYFVSVDERCKKYGTLYSSRIMYWL